MAEKPSAPHQSAFNDVDFPRVPPPAYTPTAPPGTQVVPAQNYPCGPPQVPMQPMQPTVIVAPAIPQPVYITSGTVQIGPKSSVLRCPNCNQQVKTRTKTVAHKGAHIACILLCLLGFCLCSCIPYCLKSCQDVQHFCPKCKAFIGVYRS